MGNFTSSNNAQEPAAQSRKRKIEDVEDGDKPSTEDLLHTPKKYEHNSWSQLLLLQLVN